ncbi:NADPH-dependent assimilatory sulfite reductase hemoprotein subunit [Leptospira licerasiae]|uniref:Nitrite/sulfite reductase, 4Fe-4S iron-sulfur cluster-binding domain protein n=1 Tax=Leptospira licerasiae str. MMD4847 TaxID=1049971 RepID=A0ABN0H4D5_9LEPT|nr:NADPH-dependent assimilatory sulfite reductase hemoprotein subunit [Leptospira licerasiae]EIE02037.1 nitrite/sulfite reductase ferredoxin domain / nitrite/sulfite reductase, 4Fe-4S iron-sulfur cluster-binding domain multi-domain protein [Leptospira licerasiae serovar Varillal str. VAR 010]EJZ40547.1 nitrite/sulfite reductase, 4Fe-4S iron-sulfur cluster-binding domain protein [Leptospira licerasiae str. MMD4847]
MSEQKELSEVEHIKTASKGLRGKIGTAIETGAEGFEEDDKQLIKFHGMYQQKDRDRRKDEAGEFIENPTSFMIRGRIPGGRLTSEQYMVWDDLADKFGGGALRLTTRQSIQMHTILLKDLKPIMQAVHKVNLSTMGACGDVVRNVTQALNPWGNKELTQLDPIAQLLSDHFKYKSNAYAELWLGESQLNKEDEPDPIYGTTYLPRKFKIAVTLAGNNSVDIYTNDMGFAATLDENGKIDGYFAFAGGGLGMTHNKAETYPRAADLLGWIPEKDLIPVAEGIVTSHRDFGDRTNRKHARLKYVLAEKGVEWFRSEVERRSGAKFDIARKLPKWETPNYLGWTERADGTLALGFHTLSGRIKDFPEKPLKTALKDIISTFKLNVQVTADQDLVLMGIKKEDKEKLESKLKEYNISPASPKPLYDRALACPALPTCGLALTESERTFPQLLESIQKVIDKLDLNDRAPIVRMTGCPNGCARPYSAEVGIVGQQAGGKYSLFFGGNPEGTKVGDYVAKKVPFAEIPVQLEKAFEVWKKEGNPNERFGDFAARYSLDKFRELLGSM